MPAVYPTGWPLELRFRDNAYTQEAVRLIQQKQTSVLGLFGPRAGL